MTLSERMIEKIFLSTTTGRVGYVLRIYNPWNPWQRVSLLDLDTDEPFDAVTNDLRRISEREALELNRNFKALAEERLRIFDVQARQEIEERLAKRERFICAVGCENLGTSPIESLPPHGYLICNACGEEISSALKIQCVRCEWPICTCGACRCGSKVQLHPERIDGPWEIGITLDLHTVESFCIGGKFETRRSEVGELLYKFKYESDQSALSEIVEITVDCLSAARGFSGIVVPIPPSHPTRTVTKQLARGIAVGLRVPSSDTALRKVQETAALKGIADPDRRKEMLVGAFVADADQVRGKTVLLVDDLYRSGATLKAATEVLYAQGEALSVIVFAVTRTRVHR